MPRPSVLRLAVAAAIVAPALASCADAPEYPVLATAAVAQLPTDSFATRSIEVTLESRWDGPVVVTGGTVFTSYFERMDAVGVDAALPAGGEVTVRLPLGAPTCPAGEGPTSAQLVIDTGDGELLQSVMLRDRELKPLNARACELIGGLDDE
ncbi:hypothetical protein [Demequina phytophila]|uniref:hypothetical protein n=1 Tax=Demequina phytophila TaxID=1638981 RepID=UPI0007844FDE|nr:hypothetical protein [Demequina phytophila]